MCLDHLLEQTIHNHASDLHICSGVPPVIRIHGELVYLGESILTVEACESLSKEILTEEQYGRLQKEGEIDLAYMLPGLARVRVNVFLQRSTVAMACRIIPREVPELDSLGLPEILKAFAEKQRGLVLVTGPTGSGKSTTLAAMISYINNKKRHHIITVEDPIEYLHKHNRSVVNQRELGSDTFSFAGALRAALREDPDVILIGEMRDQETIATALTAAETGHLVFSTLHTLGAAKTIDRIIDVFPPHQQPQVRSQLSTVLQGIVSQQLMKRCDVKGRVVATEVMVMTPAISNLIREARTPQINSCIHTGTELGMHSMDSCIARLLKERKINYQSACQYSIDPDTLRKLVVVN